MRERGNGGKEVLTSTGDALGYVFRREIDEMERGIWVVEQWQPPLQTLVFLIFVAKELC